MSIIEEVSWMSKSGYNDRELLEYVYENCDEIECELMEMSMKSPKSTILIIALTATGR